MRGRCRFSSPQFRFRIFPHHFIQTTSEGALLVRFGSIRGYARSSTRGGQTIAAQVKRLRAAGAKKIYRETTSGAASRVQLLRMLDELDTGDIVLVTRLDRLAQSAGDLTNILAAIAKRARASIRSDGQNDIAAACCPVLSVESRHGRSALRESE